MENQDKTTFNDQLHERTIQMAAVTFLCYFPKYLITLDDIGSADYKGIGHLHIRNFLTREW